MSERERLILKLCVVSLLSVEMLCISSVDASILKSETFKTYIDTFNTNDEELYKNTYPNVQTWDFLQKNIPLFECPDKNFERTWYFRWWTYRKHIKRTPDGFVVTEFLPKVPWSKKHNTINCPAGHQFYEGRWLHDQTFLDDYAIFYFRKGGSPNQYSTWLADAMYHRYLVNHNAGFITELLDDLIRYYQVWEKERLADDGLFWQWDGNDGMEVSIGGHGKRATINSYMYGDAVAIAKIAGMANNSELQVEYTAKAKRLRQLILEHLWDDEAQFFKILPNIKPQNEENKKTVKPSLIDVRELHGYTPWYFNIPPDNSKYQAAWKQIMDPKGFYAPYGPTTAEQRHPRFAVSYEGHECQWNGPSWPLSTSITLRAMANVIRKYTQEVVTAEDYFDLLNIYTKCHARTRKDGKVVPWIDENINPFTGEWISRTRLKNWGWQAQRGGKERGKDYNHSAYCDLIITGLVGLTPRPDDILEVNPLLPEEQWDYFCLDNVLYHGHIVTILWDKTGKHYNRNKGLGIYADGKLLASSPALTPLKAKLPN